MSNIKTIEVIEPIFGLNVGDTLTRLDENSNFTNTSELVGDGYMVSNSVSLVSDIIEGANAFKVIEYFDEPVKEESKCKCTTYKDLKNELSMYKDLYEYSLDSNGKLQSIIDDRQEVVNQKCNVIESLKIELQNSRDVIRELREIVGKRGNRIDSKLLEFEKQLLDTSKDLEKELISGERLEKLSESYTVFYNMIDLLKKIKA
jgi:hypothetical protein